jgi:hypothetical protein
MYEKGNLRSGEEVTTMSELVQLARDGKSVMIVWKQNSFEQIVVRPAAFIQNWSAWQLNRWEIYKTIKKDGVESSRK